ncbi:MAG: hypothetical protein DMF68_08260 [Acidobacteria bacterium]|nr:MAG: hypothetical protein DMF68_08260 [Acidobacteriota bacterium]
MKRKALILIPAAFVIAGAILIQTDCTTKETERQEVSSQPTPNQQPPLSTNRVPAHFEDVKSIGQLPPTLSPDRFIGPAQDAYKIAKEIPETLAQLPCYCHCDMSMGHKSLHSCFEDTHASQCAVCVSEALVAYDLQKSGKTPAEIRDRIIQVYSHQ